MGLGNAVAVAEPNERTLIADLMGVASRRVGQRALRFKRRDESRPRVGRSDAQLRQPASQPASRAIVCR